MFLIVNSNYMPICYVCPACHAYGSFVVPAASCDPFLRFFSYEIITAAAAAATTMYHYHHHHHHQQQQQHFAFPVKIVYIPQYGPPARPLRCSHAQGPLSTRAQSPDFKSRLTRQARGTPNPPLGSAPVGAAAKVLLLQSGRSLSFGTMNSSGQQDRRRQPYILIHPNQQSPGILNANPPSPPSEILNQEPGGKSEIRWHGFADLSMPNSRTTPGS